MTKISFCTALLICASVTLFAQQKTNETASKVPQVFNYVEQMPSPTFNLGEYLSKEIHYPKSALENNIEGRVIVKFVVGKDGYVKDAEIVRGIGGGCDEESKRVVMSMPIWKPGKQDGKMVDVYYTLPISFKLTDPEPPKPASK